MAKKKKRYIIQGLPSMLTRALVTAWNESEEEFEAVVASVDWDREFYADGEFYYVKDYMNGEHQYILTIPHEYDWVPEIMFGGLSERIDEIS